MRVNLTSGLKGEEKNKLSKKKLKKQSRLTVAELKQIVERPDLVEMHDVTAMDPKLLVLYRGCKYAALFSTISHFLERILMEHIE